MITLDLDISSVEKKEYIKILTGFVRNYSVKELKEIQYRNRLYKKLQTINDDKQTNKMSFKESSKYLDNLF